jgi:hypothetical protein
MDKPCSECIEEQATGQREEANPGDVGTCAFCYGTTCEEHGKRYDTIRFRNVAHERCYELGDY